MVECPRQGLEPNLIGRPWLLLPIRDGPRPGRSQRDTRVLVHTRTPDADDLAAAGHGARVCVLPEGPQTISCPPDHTG